MTAFFGTDIRKEFCLDPDLIYLNHGSFGKVPKAVSELRMRLMTDIQTNVDKYHGHERAVWWEENIAAAAKFFKADPDNLVFVQNTTTGLNCVLKTLGLHLEEAVLLHSWQHYSGANASEMTARITGCEVVVANLKLPINNKQEIVDLYKEVLEKHSNIKVAVLELICSATAVVFPIKELAALCKKHGVTVVVDGAHGPGQVPLNLEELGSNGVDCFVGSLHKWFYTPLGCSILWIHPRLHATIRPVVTSHTLDSEKPGPCFWHQGTRDDTPFYTVKAAIAFYEEMGGMEAIVQYNKDLVDEAVAMLVKEWNTGKLPIPSDMEAPCMRLVKLPYVRGLEAQNKNAIGNAPAWRKVFVDRFNISVSIFDIYGDSYVRLSCNIYNTLEDYQRLAKAVEILVKEDTDKAHVKSSSR